MCPFTKSEVSDARNTADPLRSSTVPHLAAGIFAMMNWSNGWRKPSASVNLVILVTVQYLTVTRKNPFQIGCADRIFAVYSKFSYGQRSKCADLLNSYLFSSNFSAVQCISGHRFQRLPAKVHPALKTVSPHGIQAYLQGRQ